MKTPLFLPVLCAGATLLLAATARAYDPYQSRLDREYQSFSAALSRAYAVPAPSYSPPPSYSSSAPYSSPSSSNSSSSYRPNSGGYSSYAKPEPPPKPLSAAERAKLDKEMKLAAEKKAALDKLAEAAMWDRIRAADARAAHERWRLAPVMLDWEWKAMEASKLGRAPLHTPSNMAMETKDGEFWYYKRFSTDPNAKWENLRLGQMSLDRAAPAAVPSDAFGYFSRANPDWVETQFGLGVCYLNGLGVAADSQKAREWLEKAASFAPIWNPPAWLGSGEFQANYDYRACRELAYAYDYGRGLPADPALALEWYKSARNRPLNTKDEAEMDALITDFWGRHAEQSRALLEAEFVRNQKGDSKLDVSGADAKTLYEIGEFVDSRPHNKGDLTIGRAAAPFFFEAAKQGYEPAARAYFSPAKNGIDAVDLSAGGLNRSLNGAQLDWVNANWLKWEAKWKAASEAGDAGANLPLAFYYSGARGNARDAQQAFLYGSKIPADTPQVQRNAIRGSLSLGDSNADSAWLRALLTRFNVDFTDDKYDDKFDVTRLPGAPDVARGAQLREAADALDYSDFEAQRKGWIEAAALGDLVALMRIYSHANEHNIRLGSKFRSSLVTALEQAASNGERGAALVLATSLSFADVDKRWENQVKQGASKTVAFEAVAADPNATDAQYDAARAPAKIESDAWIAEAKKWSVKENWLDTGIALLPNSLAKFDADHRAFMALRKREQPLEAQLDFLEKSVVPRVFNPESDDSFIEGYRAWIPQFSKTPPDYVAALDAFSRSANQGHPFAPMAIATFYSSGAGGFPRDLALAKRWRALAASRMEILAQSGDAWAQITLGDLLTENPHSDSREELWNREKPRSGTDLKWLPQDKERGLKLLQTAALNGEVLPFGFGDSTGMPVTFLIQNRYSDWREMDNWAKWNAVEQLYYAMSEDFTEVDQKPTAAQLAKFKTDAQKILASGLKYKEPEQE